MTLISSIITDAYREANIIRLGGVPTANQVAEALRLYNGVLGSVYGDDAGEGLADWPLGTYGNNIPGFQLPYDPTALVRPPLNRRLIATNLAALTLYLSPRPQDGARMGIADPFGRLALFPVTLDASGRTIEGAATKVLNTNGLFQEWFYRADLGQWVKLTNRLESEENPFPAEFDTFFITSLALRLNPRNGRTMDEQSAMVYKSERKKFVARYVQSAPLETDDSISWPFMSTQSYNTVQGFGSTRAFNSGRWW